MANANIVNKSAQASSFRVRTKTRLLERGLTVTDLAASLGRSRNAVSIAINHETMFPSIKKLIQEALKL